MFLVPQPCLPSNQIRHTDILVHPFQRLPEVVGIRQPQAEVGLSVISFTCSSTADSVREAVVAHMNSITGLRM